MAVREELKVPGRILMGPGPSDVAPSVLQAMALPLLGHLDPAFLEIMNDNMAQLRTLFGTENQLTVPMSGTGSAGMETAMANILEPGDTILIGVKGVFGQRMVDVAQRCGARVLTVEAPWGQALKPEQFEEVLRAEPGIKAVAVVHAETSTGVRQPLEELSRLTHEHGALFVVDAVTSLGGIPVEVDKNRIDVCYSGTQKCLSAPPGLSPVTFSPKAAQLLAARKSKVQSWYLDLSMIQKYWGGERLYHHTAPISMNYALREALRRVLDEGVDAAYARHAKLGGALQAGLEAMGLKLLVDKEIRLPQLTTVFMPEGTDDAKVRGRLLREFGIEISGGLGDLKGKIWRIGLMGYSCQPRNVVLLLTALEQILTEEGQTIPRGAAVDAAMRTMEA